MPRPIAIDDFMKLRIVSDPQVAPDGAQIACVVRITDGDKNRYRSEIWVVPTHGGQPRRFTSKESSNSSPRWSPDGRTIAFLSDRCKPKSQIYLLPADGGEARTLTELDIEGNIGGLRWSPDGSRIAFLFRATPAAQRKEVEEEREKAGISSPVRHHMRLFYRLDGSGYFDDEYSQIWVADAGTGECHAMTSGPYECSLPVWSPDGRTLAFLSDRREDGDITSAHDDLYTIAAEGGELHRIPTPPGSKSGLAWSPDGTHFAYVGNPDPDDSWGTCNNRLMVLSAEGGTTALDLTGLFDVSVGFETLSDSHDVGAGDLLHWSDDGAHLTFPVSTMGDTRLYAIATDGNGEPVCLTQCGCEVGGFSSSRDGLTVAMTLGTPVAPHELFCCERAQGVPTGELVWRQLADLNRTLLDALQVTRPEPVEIRHDAASAEVSVHGWLLKPADFAPGTLYPLVVYVHGGPHAQYGNTFFHELQFLAAAGYVVLYTNPRGSKGYGEAHTQAIRGCWGGPDFVDVMAAVDYAVGLEYVDAHRTAIMGGSYGGYMTAWAVGHTNRFRCAIADRLVGNLHSMSGTCDFPWKHGAYFKGDAWSDPSDLWNCSPLAYAGNITTPLLIIHSDGDLRCPAGQAEELFTALRLQRKTVEYVRYPAESSHGLSRNGPPDLRLDRLNRNRAWLDRWLKP